MIEIFKVIVTKISDPQRIIDEVVFPENTINFFIRQCKTLVFSDEAVSSGMPVGNHYHIIASGRKELFVAIGQEEVPLIIFRFRNEIGGPIMRIKMFNGDACLIPSGHSHSFVALVPGTILGRLSNIPYDAIHDIKDDLGNG